jgi:Domain of unknown function (DUF5034)
MKLKKIIIILIFPFLIELLMACCDCVEPVIQHYSYKTFTINNLDNSGKEPVLSTNLQIIKAAYGMEIKFQRDRLACAKKTKPFIFQSAYAFKCVCPPENQILPKDSITSIKIITYKDFDNNHLANSEITEYFKVYRYSSFTTIQQYFSTLNLIIYNENQLEFKTNILLTTPPSINSKHKFRIQINLSDGRKLIQDSPEIELI